MRMSKRSIRRIIRENCGDPLPELEAVPMAAEFVTETTDETTQDLMVEIAVAGQALETVIESLQNAAHLCYGCEPGVATHAPMMEAIVAQAGALQEMLGAEADIIVESSDLGYPEGAVDLPGEEALAVGIQAELEELV